MLWERERERECNVFRWTERLQTLKIPRKSPLVLLVKVRLKQSKTSGKKKCTLVQALRLYTGRTAHRIGTVIALLFLDHGTRRGWGVSVTPRPLFTPRKDSVPIAQTAGWAPGPVWTGAENLAPTGIRFADCPASIQPLYRLSYRAHGKEEGK